MKGSLKKLSVVIPAYNEAPTLREIIGKVQRVDIGMDKEIIIVDDGSTDGTTKVLRQWIKGSDGKIKVFSHHKNRGKGAALRTGFQQITGDVVIIQDADLEYSPEEYPPLLLPILDGRADVVYGSRFLGGPHRVFFFWHYVGNKFLTLLSNMVNNLNLTDMETGYKAFRSEVIEGMEIKSNGFAVEPELTAKVARGGWRIYEVPISYSGRTYPEGKKITWRDGMKAIYSILRFRLCN